MFNRSKRIFGYKRLKFNSSISAWMSPVMGDCWNKGELNSKVEPLIENTSGIYLCKSIKDNELYKYPGDIWLCEIDISKPYIEHEFGYRAAHVIMIKKEISEDEYWEGINCS